MVLYSKLYSLTQQVLYFLSHTEFKETTIEPHELKDNTSYDLIWLWRDKVSSTDGRVIGIAPVTPVNNRQFHIHVSDVIENAEHSLWTEVLSPDEFQDLKYEFLSHCYFQ